MIVRVDPASPVPAYEQLRSQVAAMVVTGTLDAGERLPPIRRLASDLDLAPGTVARAYRELEAAGLVVAAGRRGTVVAPTDDWVMDPGPATDELLRRAARRYAVTVRQLGVARADALAAVDAQLPQDAADEVTADTATADVAAVIE